MKALARVMLVAVILAAAGIALLVVMRSAPKGPAASPTPDDALAWQAPATAAQRMPPTNAQQTQESQRAVPVEATAIITFPDGSTVTVRKRRATLPAPPPSRLPAMHLKDVYEQLVQLAWGGDAAAARSLSQELRFCDSVRALSRPPGNTELEPGIELSAAQAQRLQHPQEYCREITEEDTTNAVHWAKVAADAGDYVGMQDWAVMQGMTDAGYETWDSLWKRGYVFAITPLAIAYSKGVPSSAGGKADSVTSFAFRYAYYKLQEARLEGRNTQGTRRVLSTLQAEIQYSGGSLSPGEYQQAIELAKRLLADNRNCCIPPSW